MALSHRTHPTYGIQFHPESVLTEGGHALFANFLGLARAWRERPAPGGPAMLWRDGRVVAGHDRAPRPHRPRPDARRRPVRHGAGARRPRRLRGRPCRPARRRPRRRFGIPADRSGSATAMRALAGAGGGARLAIRTTLTRGSGPRGLKPPDDPRPTLFATAAPSARSVAFAPLRLWPTAIARNDTSPAARLKTLGYLRRGARRPARPRRRASTRRCSRNTRGRVACAGTGNLFALFGRSSGHAAARRRRAGRDRARGGDPAARRRLRARARGTVAEPARAPAAPRRCS